ncbi:hypothetical protein NHX12_016288, partial [Muraenolepis orangiensis]
ATTKLQRERVIELQYADDCALVSHNPQDLQSVLTAAVRAYSRMGLTVNTIKTEVVASGVPTSHLHHLPSLLLVNNCLLYHPSDTWGAFSLRTTPSTMRSKTG